MHASKIIGDSNFQSPEKVCLHEILFFILVLFDKKTESHIHFKRSNQTAHKNLLDSPLFPIFILLILCITPTQRIGARVGGTIS